MTAMNWTLALPELVLACAAMATLVVGAFAGRSANLVCAAMSVGSLLLTAVLVLAGGTGPAVGLSGTFVVDGFAVFIKLLCLGAGIVAILMARDWLQAERIERFEFHVLIQLATLGMLVMASASDLMTLYLGLEPQSLSLYVIAAFARDDLRSS